MSNFTECSTIFSKAYPRQHGNKRTIKRLYYTPFVPGIHRELTYSTHPAPPMLVCPDNDVILWMSCYNLPDFNGKGNSSVSADGLEAFGARTSADTVTTSYQFRPRIFAKWPLEGINAYNWNIQLHWKVDTHGRRSYKPPIPISITGDIQWIGPLYLSNASISLPLLSFEYRTMTNFQREQLQVTCSFIHLGKNRH